MTLLESIVQDLKELSTPKLVEVAGYVHELSPENRARRFAALAATAGCMNGEEGEDFERAVRSESERVDSDVK
jgi:hypothetical protein